MTSSEDVDGVTDELAGLKIDEGLCCAKSAHEFYFLLIIYCNLPSHKYTVY